MQKDLVSAKCIQHNEFIAVTNSDLGHKPKLMSYGLMSKLGGRNSMREIIESCEERRKSIKRRYWKLTRALRKQARTGERKESITNVEDKIEEKGEFQRMVPTVEELGALLSTFPTFNSLTHFACIMDPKSGKVLWGTRWPWTWDWSGGCGDNCDCDECRKEEDKPDEMTVDGTESGRDGTTEDLSKEHENDAGKAIQECDEVFLGEVNVDVSSD
jgi:hypothetical protein